MNQISSEGFQNHVDSWGREKGNLQGSKKEILLYWYGHWVLPLPLNLIAA